MRAAVDRLRLVLETARLKFVPMCPEHAALIVELDSDPEVKRFIDGGRPTSFAEARRFVSSSIGHRWIALTGTEDHFVGWFGPVPTGARERELGYRLKRSSWGAGLATEGAIALRDHAFDVLDVDRVWAQTMVVNSGSRRVLEKAGLELVRAFFAQWPDQIEGSEDGDVEYELRRTRWLELVSGVGTGLEEGDHRISTIGRGGGVDDVVGE